MPKNKLFDEGSDEEVAIKTENEYAKKYDAWREKEELHKLEQKYGSKVLNSDADDVEETSDSEDDSDEPLEVSEEVEKQFLKTLALLKTKDPRIYDPQYKFFDDKVEKEKEKEPEKKKLIFGDSDDGEDDDPNIFSIEKKAEIDQLDNNKDTSKKSVKEDKIKDFLIGKAEHVDQELENDLAPLRALWSDPKINDGEAFLRDYILNKKYLDDGDVGEAEDKIRDDADLEEDEKQVEEQGKFERAYNFRFEEPDDEYLKRFPRTMNYIRPKDDRRSRKRAELRARKEEEKKQKMEEIARMKALKLKEIQEKIAKIKEVTGNQDLAFQEADIEGDFDPEEHDRRMKALFDEQYYGETDDHKPVFPDLDEELEIENWEKYEHQEYHNEEKQEAAEDDLHCEDENFNMDADYDPKQAKLNLLEELKQNMGKKRRNRKRKSKLAQILAQEKPKFVPGLAKKYSEFMQEYYQMDCEDIIGGDLPTRFKYREVVPNDFGLTVEEILLANDSELTQWVPLKKIVKYRPENVEKGDVKIYSQKAADERLKKKILPSLFKDMPEQPDIVVPPEKINTQKKGKKKHKQQVDPEEENEKACNIFNKNSINQNIEETVQVLKKNKKHKEENEVNDITEDHISVAGNIVDDNIGNHKKKKKRKHDSKNEIEPDLHNDTTDVAASQINVVINHELRSEEFPNNDLVHDLNIENNDKVKESTMSATVNDKIKNNKKLKKTKKDKNSFTVDTVIDEEPTKNTNAKENGENEVKKKNKQQYTFVVENLIKQNYQTQGSKQVKNIQANNLNEKKNRNERKRKLESVLDTSVSKKKLKKNKNKQEINIQSKNIKNKGKNDKFKSKNKVSSSNDTSENPLSNLSDERLKAYGLNPKKYRSFLKYKKF